MSESLELKIEAVLEKLEQHKETHPVFVKVWTLYLREKMNNLKNTLAKCEQVADSNLSDTPDLDPQLLASLVTLF